MARIRKIHPSFATNEELGATSPLARLLFALLPGHADREGRLEDRPMRLKVSILPYDACNIDELLDELQEAGVILRYSLKGSAYVQILNFLKYQCPHKNEPDSVIPPPAESEPEADEERTEALEPVDYLHDFPAELASEEFEAAWEDWIQHRRQIKKRLTSHSVRSQFKQMLSWGHDRAVAALRHSVMNGYQGLFEPSGGARRAEEVDDNLQRALSFTQSAMGMGIGE